MQALPDKDGRRTEIVCAACDGCVRVAGRVGLMTERRLTPCCVCVCVSSHMGHVFKGEGFKTPTDERHCVNSVSLVFHAGEAPLKE